MRDSIRRDNLASIHMSRFRRVFNAVLPDYGQSLALGMLGLVLAAIVGLIATHLFLPVVRT